jgi:hypothetical protein
MEENLTIPIITIACGFVAWAVYLTVGHFTNKQNINANVITVQNMQQDLQEIKDMQAGMNTKLDQYIAQENSFLKEAFIFMQNIIKRDNGIL